MTERVPVPAFLVEHAVTFAESGAVPVRPRAAATVVLTRAAEPRAAEPPAFEPAGGGFEVYVQRRVATMAFAASMYAFPGGSVDDRDSAPVGWVGPTPAWWAVRFGLPETQAQAVVCAAVREVFEECGVLLAGPDDSTVVSDVSSDEWEDARVALLAREVALVDVLGSRGLRVRADLLAAWDRWLTPEFEPRRYDTFFFLARLPAGQRTRDVGGESDHSAWLPAAEAAKLPMLPPTRYTLDQLALARRVEDAVAIGNGRDLSRPLLPHVASTPDGDWLVLDR